MEFVSPRTGFVSIVHLLLGRLFFITLIRCDAAEVCCVAFVAVVAFAAFVAFSAF